MNVSSTQHLEDFVKEKVHSGLYSSSSEVIREGLRLLAQRDSERETQIAELRKAIQEGLDSGPASDLEAMKVEARRLLAQRSSNAKGSQNTSR